jgi:hypothetical protein
VGRRAAEEAEGEGIPPCRQHHATESLPSAKRFLTRLYM